IVAFQLAAVVLTYVSLPWPARSNRALPWVKNPEPPSVPKWTSRLYGTFWSLPLPTTWKLRAAPTAPNTLATKLFASRLALADEPLPDGGEVGPWLFLPDEHAVNTSEATATVTSGVSKALGTILSARKIRTAEL